MAADERGLDLITETVTAAGSFPTVLRGYDRHAVDDYVRSIEHQLLQRTREVRELQTEVRDLADRPVADTSTEPMDAAAVAGHASTMLSSARHQAEEIVAQGHRTAEATIEDATLAAEQIRRLAERDAEDTRLAATVELREVRDRVHARSQEQLASVTGEGDQLLAAARREAEAVTLDARTRADTMIATAKAEADALVQKATAEAARLTAEAADQREQTLSTLATEQTEVSNRINGMLAEARAGHEDALARLRTETETAAAVRADALAEAERIRVTAVREAQEHLNKLETMLRTRRNQAQSEWRRHQLSLREQTDRLLQRRQALAAQLKTFAALAEQSGSELGEVDLDSLMRDLPEPEPMVEQDLVLPESVADPEPDPTLASETATEAGETAESDATFEPDPTLRSDPSLEFESATQSESAAESESATDVHDPIDQEPDAPGPDLQHDGVSEPTELIERTEPIGGNAELDESDVETRVIEMPAPVARTAEEAADGDPDHANTEGTGRP